MRVLDPVDKIDFFCKKMVGQADVLNDASVMHWIPKLMELGIFFLKDDNRYDFVWCLKVRYSTHIQK
jgi:hypothetical protein